VERIDRAEIQVNHTTFDEVTDAIEQALRHPDELSVERRRVGREVVGELDGLAGERVVDAIFSRANGRL
jgi:hypothetical protein